MTQHASAKAARLVASANSDNAAIAFNGPVILNDIIGYNAKAAIVYLKLYQLGPALAVPTNADTPFLTIALGASGVFRHEFPKGIRFGFGLGYRLVTGSADNDAAAVLANDILGLNFLAG